MHEPGVGCLAALADVLFALGYPDQALKRIYEALSLAREVSHPYSLCAGLCNAAGIHLLRGEQQAAHRLVASILALSTEQGFVRLSAYGTFYQGWGLAEQGETEAGIVQMRRGLAALCVTGAEAGRPWLVALLAEAHGKIGKAEEGLKVLAEALTAVRERSWESELYRCKGELTLQSTQVKTSRQSADQSWQLKNIFGRPLRSRAGSG